MRVFKRVLLLLLALALILGALVSCNTQNEEETWDDYYEDEDDYDIDFPDVEKADYDMEFSMYMMSINNFPEFYVLDESNGSPMDEAVYARQEKIKRYLGVDMVLKTDSNTNKGTYIDVLKKAVTNRDGTLELLLTHYNIGLPELISDNYLMDFSDMDGVDLEADYWDYDFMSSVELKGHNYLGFGDANILFAYLVSFNKNMMDQYSGADVFGGKDVYQMVRDYEWTLDKMISIANLVSQDLNGDGKKDQGDKFGYAAAAWEPYMSFIHASGMNIMEQDLASGAYKVALNSDKYYARLDNLIADLKALSASECAYVDYRVKVVHAEDVLQLTSNRVLMSIYDTIHLPEYLNYNIEFGVLPLPMYDGTEKEYRALQYGGLMCVPRYVKDAKMVGETLEMYHYYSSSVTVTFYEKILGRQVADAPDDTEMLNIIRAGACTDVGFTYQNTTTVASTTDWNTLGGCMVRLTNPATTDGGLASWFAKHVQAQQNGFDNFYKKVK
ncbi:MAG: hypothetical protein IJC64_00540 [Clostridia bacterium]|nr:hypothetical protein [Clostridia bacterium]